MKYGRLGEADVCKIRRGRERGQPGMSIGRRAAIDSMRTKRAMKGDGAIFGAKMDSRSGRSRLWPATRAVGEWRPRIDVLIL